MNDLTQSECVPCRGDVPTLTDPEIKDLRPQIPAWRVAEVEGVKRIEREFAFPNFRDAMAFAVRVGGDRRRRGPPSRHPRRLGKGPRRDVDSQAQGPAP